MRLPTRGSSQNETDETRHMSQYETIVSRQSQNKCLRMSNDAEKFVSDGDTLVIVARTQQEGPTVSDPCNASPYLSQAYRVVSDRVGPTLALVPLGTRAVRVSQNETDQFAERKRKEADEFEEMSLAFAEATVRVCHARSIWLLPHMLNEISTSKKSAQRASDDNEKFDPTGTFPGRCT